jgi:hypothetical protein
MFNSAPFALELTGEPVFSANPPQDCATRMKF